MKLLRSRNQKSQSGIGLVEVLFALGIMVTVATILSYYINHQRSQSRRIGDKNECSTLTSSIINQLKSNDNSLIVRNWNTSIATNPRTTMPSDDPFCNSVGGRTPLCDPFPMVSTKPGGYVNLADLRTFLNIRGAYTWASALYNQNLPGICSLSSGIPNGMQLTPADLGKLLPGMSNFPAWVTQFNLYIKEVNSPCGTPATSSASTFNIQVAAKYVGQNTPVGQLESCSSNTTVAAAIDSDNPEMAITRVYNGLGANVPNGYCTDRRNFAAASSSPTNLWQTVHFDFNVNEPGSIMLCRKEAPWELTPAGDYFNCPDTPLTAGSSAITPNAATITYNSGVSGIVSHQGMADRGGLESVNSMYGFSFTAADTSQNLSSSSPTFNFMVHSPGCIDSNIYCPGASYATPDDAACASCGGVPNPNCEECWDTRGDKNRRPYDNCMNDLCPDGTRPPVCDAAQAPFVCTGSNYADDCGLDRCPGSMPQVCPPGPYNTIPCGNIVPGQCIANCGTGTGINTTGLNIMDYDCNCVIQDLCGNDTGLRGVGGNGGAITCPPPPPATIGNHQPNCDCTGVDLTTVPCGTAVDDICSAPATAADVTPASCGPGTMGCSACAPMPPSPPIVCNEPPSSGTWQCKDHQWLGDTTCDMPRQVIVVNPTCATYTLTITPTGHRHGGSSLRYRVLWSGPYYNISKSDGSIGPTTPSHGGNPTGPLNALPGLPPVTLVYRTIPGLPVTINRISIYNIHDSSLSLNWTVTPSTP